MSISSNKPGNALPGWIYASATFLCLLWVYSASQRGLFAAGFTDFPAWFHTLDSIINSMLLPGTFFLAGAVLKVFNRQQRAAILYTYLWDKFLYVFVLWVVVQNILEIFFSGYTGRAALFSDIYFDFVSQPSNHLWLLVALGLNIYIFTLLNRPKLQGLIHLLAAISLAYHLFPETTSLIYPLVYIQKYFLYVLVGYHLCARLEQPLSPAAVLLLLAVFLVSQLSFHVLLGLESYPTNLPTLLLAFPGICLVILFGKLLNRCTIGQLLGKLALPVYLLQYTIIGGTREFLSNSLSVDSLWLHLLLACFLCVSIPLLLLLPGVGKFAHWLFAPPRRLSAQKLSALACRNTGAFKKLQLIATSLLLLSGFAGLTLYIGSNLKLSHLPQKDTAVFPMQAGSEQEGQRLAAIYGCYLGCHGNRLQGIPFHKVPMRGVFHSPNLTQSVLKYSDTELAGMIRTGMRPDGSPLIAGMPSAGYSAMPDTHLADILAFIRSQPVHNRPSQTSSLGLLTRLDILRGQFRYQHDLISEAEAHFTQNSQGERWVRAACSECHGHLLEGNAELAAPPLVVARAYDRAHFKRLLQEGIKRDGTSAGLMAVVAKTRFAKFTDAELEIIFNYLSTLQ